MMLAEEVLDQQVKGDILMRTDKILKMFKEKELTILEVVTQGTTLKDKLACEDKDGYRYKTNYNYLRRGVNPLPFSHKNEYTIYNIKIYLKKFKPEFKLLSAKYITATNSNMIIECVNGHESNLSWHVLQREETRCTMCSQPNRSLTRDNFVVILGGEFELIGEYINASTDVILKHKCGHEYKIQPSRFIINKPGCSKCLNLLRKTTDEFKQEVFDMHGNEYEVLGEYVQSHNPVKVKHSCGYEYKVSPTNLLNNKGCAQCAGTIVLSHDEFVKRVEKETDRDYTVLGIYKSGKEKILLKHSKCGYEWQVRPSHFLSAKSRCPMCNKTLNRAEKELGEFIRELLIHSNYSLVQQYWFDDCRGKNNNPYYFDYAIIDENENVTLIIERHGNQHYEYVPFIHRNIVNFHKQLERDNEKVKYCNTNNIPLEVIEARRSDHEIECEKVLKILKDFNII